MVHVLELLGCTANGATTEAALEATPEAIRAYLRFLQRCGEAVDASTAFATRIEEHVTVGMWLGNGSPYLVFGPDLEPVTADEIETYLHRFQAMRDELARWAEQQDSAALDRPVAGGRTNRAILLHILGVPGAYLSAALGGASGFSRIVTLAERDQLPLAEALRQIEALVAEVVRGTTPEQRRAIVQRPKDVRTLRKAIRRILEHDWEHLVELSRRAGGPRL